MTTAYFTAVHKEFRGRVRAFLAHEVLPYVDEWERCREIPRHIWRKLGQAGFLGLHYSRSFGGADKDIFHSVILLEELGRTGYVGFRVAVAAHAYMATPYLAHAATDALAHKYLTPAIDGRLVSALGLTEPVTGCDLAGVQTTAVGDGANYVVDGTKQFVANGTTADFLIVAARTSPVPARGTGGLSLFVIDAHSPGVSARKLDNLGWHSSDMAEVVFDGVRVPASNIIGSPNQASLYILHGLQLERLAAGILAIGGIDACLELTWQYVCECTGFDGPLSELQAVRHRMADLVTETEAARQLAYHAAWLHQHGTLPIAECGMVKLKASELASRVVNECLQLHGAQGYLNDSAVSRMYRDTQAATVAGGAGEIMRDLIAKSTLDDHGWRVDRGTPSDVLERVYG